MIEKYFFKRSCDEFFSDDIEKQIFYFTFKNYLSTKKIFIKSPFYEDC